MLIQPTTSGKPLGHKTKGPKVKPRREDELSPDSDERIINGFRVRDRDDVELSREMGRIRLEIECPFCGDRCVGYVWSLAGSGKLCDCGAKHGLMLSIKK